jgi:uncharacterized membrane protein
MQDLYTLTIGIGDNLRIYMLDLLAFSWFAITWLSYGIWAERITGRRENLLTTMHRYRLRWMQQMLKREARMPDMSGIGNLLRSISFFANTSIFLVLASATLIGYRDQARQVIDAIPFALPTSDFVWEFKVFLIALIFINGFFKFTWSVRQYNYICIYIGAAPAPKEDIELHQQYAENGAKLMSNAAKHFNLGLRAYYYGFAVLSWFINPLAFIFATTLVIWVLYRREFRSGLFMILVEGTSSPMKKRYE